jgi:hypothetical protein
MVAGNGFTVTVVVRKHPVPVPIVNVMVTVFADTPVTTPVVLTTDPIRGLLLVQVPPGPLVRVVVSPWQTAIVPVITEGNGFTVIVITLKHPVGSI